jgi:hypothetical protein
MLSSLPALTHWLPASGMDKSSSNNDPAVEVVDREENSGRKWWSPGKAKIKATMPRAVFRGVKVQHVG